jgi:L-xylulokinase
MTSPKTLLAIDKGTTNIKAVLFDLGGKQLEAVSRPCKTEFSNRPGWNEQDMNASWELTRDVIHTLLRKGYSARNILSVGVSGLGNGLLLVDENGQPVRNAIMSIDTRAKDLLKTLSENGTDAIIKKITQFNLYGGSATVLLRWLKENESNSYDKIRWIIYSKDWINYKLTGNISTDQTDASGGALTNSQTGEFAKEVFSYLGIEECRDKLPEMIPTWELCGHVTRKAADETGLLEGTPVISGAHDIAASVWGAGGTDEGHLTMIVGTCGLNLLVLNELKPTENAVLQHAIPNRWLAVNGDNNSASSLEWFVNTFCQEEITQAKQKGVSVFQVLEEKIKKSSSSNIIFHPFLNGSIDNAAALSGLYGVGAWHTKENILRAVYEGVAFSHCQCIDTLRESLLLKKANLVGGGAKSNIWGQIFSDIIGVPVQTFKTEEITARGVALSAGIGAGIYNSHEEADIPLILNKEFFPNPVNREKYLKQYELFKKTVTDLRNTWEEMHQIAKL